MTEQYTVTASVETLIVTKAALSRLFRVFESLAWSDDEAVSVGLELDVEDVGDVTILVPAMSVRKNVSQRSRTPAI